MIATETLPLDLLYEADETGWLETMSALAAARRYHEMDFRNLSEYLSDMALRDRRELNSRMVVLMAHLLKWEHQPDRRSGSWRSSIRTQRREVNQMLESGTLWNHAESILSDVYRDARMQAADETELDLAIFPVHCKWSLDGYLIAFLDET